MQKHYSKCLVFAFGFVTCIKTILPLINRLINETLLVADHVSITCYFSSLTHPLVSDKHVPHVGFSRCLHALEHWCGFHAASGESEWCTLL